VPGELALHDQRTPSAGVPPGIP